MTRLLGAVLAGGRSSRFGSDKALAELDGKPLLQHAADALAAQTDAVIVCGRSWPGLTGIPDHPAPDLGPLGGLNAALHYAVEQGFDAVLTVGCDTPMLPHDLAEQLAAGGDAAYFLELPVIGRWPASLAPLLAAHLASSDDRSMRAWVRHAGAVAVTLDTPLANVNTSASLIALQRDR